MPSSSSPPRVIIVGAGFGGLAAARRLRKAPVRLTVVDKRNHHLFQPLLYQVATAALAATDIAAPIRKLLMHQANTTVLLARAVAVDAAKKVLVLADGELPYDYLVLAAGMTNAYFGKDAWQTNAPGLKSLHEALDIRRRILLAYEAAERETDPAARREWLTFVIIGGGPTGVELAGALREIAQRTMAQNFRNYDPAEARVILLEGSDRVLASFPKDLSDRALAQLRTLGVEVRLNTRAQHIHETGVDLVGERIGSRTVLWAAGVRGVPLATTLGVPTDKMGRLQVAPDLSVPGLDGVFVIGDLAAFTQDGELVPGVAPAAIQEGRHAAANIERLVRKEAPLPFHYRDKGSMATIGRSRAVALVGGLRLWGALAWLAWLFVHLMTLVGFRNRVVVFFEWAWSYLTYQRSARIILESPVDTPASSK